MTGAERAEAEELEKINMKMSDMKVRIEQLKKKSAKQSTHLDTTEHNGKKNEIVFKSNQEEAIRENLEQMYVFNYYTWFRSIICIHIILISILQGKRHTKFNGTNKTN